MSDAWVGEGWEECMGVFEKGSMGWREGGGCVGGAG